MHFMHDTNNDFAGAWELQCIDTFELAYRCSQTTRSSAHPGKLTPISRHNNAPLVFARTKKVTINVMPSVCSSLTMAWTSGQHSPRAACLARTSLLPLC
jgi:hypothetical protein